MGEQKNGTEMEQAAEEAQASAEAPRATGVYLADGTYLAADLGYAGGEIWIWMRDEEDNDCSFSYLVFLFADTAKTSRMEYVWGKGDTESYEGFTYMRAIVRDADNKISIRMVKPGGRG